MATLSFKTYIDLNTRKLRIEDTTNYPSQGLDTAIQLGCIKLVTPAGTVYNNTDFTSPDIIRSGSAYSGWINLPVNRNGFVVGGTYTVYYTSKNGIDGASSANNVSYTYSFTIPAVALIHNADGYASTLSSVDSTDYGSNITSFARSHTVTPPPGSSLSATINSNATISYPANIWSGDWVSSITSTVRYTMIDGLILDYVYSKSITTRVHKVDMETVTGYMEIMTDDWKRLLTVNRAKAQQKLEQISKVYAAYDLYDLFLYYGNTIKAYEQAVEIIDSLNDYYPANPTSEEITPFESDTPVTGGLTPEQIARLNAAYNHSLITGESSIHHQHSNKAALDDIINTGDGTKFLGDDAQYYNLQVTVPSSGTYNESHLDVNRKKTIGHSYDTMNPRVSLWNGAGKEIKEINVDIIPISNSLVEITHYEDPIVGTYRWTIDGISNASSGGGSGTTDHAALTNLDYDSSGHTGFEPAKGIDDNYMTDAEKTKLAGLSNSVMINSFEIDISIGITELIHNIGVAPAFVNFFIDGEQQFFSWERNELSPTTSILIASNEAFENVEINIIPKSGVYTLVQDIALGVDIVIVHALGKRPKFASFIVNNIEESFNWKVDPANPTTQILVSNQDELKSNVEINLI